MSNSEYGGFSLDEILERSEYGTLKAYAELTQLRKRVESLERSQHAHENDCAVLPENVSVTEFVTQLRATVAALTEQNAQQTARLRLKSELISSLVDAMIAHQERIAELENDVICPFCGTHYHVDDAPPEHWRICHRSPLVWRIIALEAQLDQVKQVTP